MTIETQLEGLTNAELIQLFEAVKNKLNLKTITDFAATHGIVYNTAKTKIPFVTVCNTKYLPDNGRH
jgi:hypothetical protein